ncbi:hypothetical protein AOLI_G00041660 [Acnodon oligacanthus]
MCRTGRFPQAGTGDRQQRAMENNEKKSRSAPSMEVLPPEVALVLMGVDVWSDSVICELAVLRRDAEQSAPIWESAVMMMDGKGRGNYRTHKPLRRTQSQGPTIDPPALLIRPGQSLWSHSRLADFI